MRPLTYSRHTLAITALAAGLGWSLAPTTQADPLGFDFYLGSSASSVLDAANEFGGVRFTATDSFSIDTLHLDMNFGSGTVTYALQADDGFGNPSGVDLASGTTTAGAGFKTASITPTALVNGTTYHIVVRPGTGTAGLRVALGDTKGNINTIDGSPAPNAAQMFSSNSGTSWSEFSFASRAMVWGVSNSSTNQAQGQPYDTSIVKNMGANIYRGQTFTQDSGQDVNVNSITVSVTRNTGTAATAGDAEIRILDADTLNVVYSADLFTPGDIAEGTNEFFTHNIASGSEPTLEDGELYLVAVTSRDSTSTAVYNFRTVRTDVESGDLMGQNYQGDTGHHVIGVLNGAGVITSLGNDDTATLKHDSFFLLDTSPVPEPGSLALIGLGSLAMLTRRKK